MSAQEKFVYTIVPHANGARWVRIGRAFADHDGSLTVVLDALPVSGRLQVRDTPPTPKAKP